MSCVALQLAQLQCNDALLFLLLNQVTSQHAPIGARSDHHV